MRIERINENSIRCILTSFDLSVRNLNLRELAYGTDKAKKLFEEMMSRANDEVGFNAENTPIMIEAIPMTGNAIQIVITKVEDPEELDTRFSKFSQSRQPSSQNDEWLKKLTNELLEGADGILQKLKESGLISERQAAGAASRQGRRQPGEAAQTPDAEGGYRVFAFDDLDQVIAASKAIASFDIDSRLYKKADEDRSYYVLVLKMRPDKGEDLANACNMAAEYGRKLKAGTASIAYYEEHYKTVVAEEAVQKLSRI